MDVEDFDALYAGSFDRLVGQLRAMTGADTHEASDCVQEAFVRAWSHREAMSRVDSPEAWLRVTAYRLAVSRWRRVLRSRRPADRAVSPSAHARPPDENRVALEAALDRLPADQRRALVLFHLCDLSVAQVSAEVGAPEGTVKARLSRGRVALQRLLADDEDLASRDGLDQDGVSRV